MMSNVHSLLVDLIRENESVKRAMIVEFFDTTSNSRREQISRLLEAAGL